MRVAVFGSGGVGGYFGARLAQAGQEVVFIARGAHLAAMRENGLRIESTKGDFVINPVQAQDDPARVGQVDVILVGVKAWQVAEAAQAMQPMVGPDTLIVPLQNGVDAPASLAAALGNQHVLGGMCQISVFVAGPGHVRHVGIEPFIAIGELDRQPSRRVERLLQVFTEAGIKAEIPDDIHVAMWEKFLFIASISGVCAATHAPVGVIRSIPETRRLLERAMQEVLVVAQARQIRLAEDTVARRLEFIESMSPTVQPSMARDILEGRPSELGSQSGAVVRMGLEYGVATQVHAFLYHCLLPLELRARGEVQF